MAFTRKSKRADADADVIGEDFEGIAYHEAGHAVAMFRAGAFPSVTIIGTDDYRGKVSPDGLEDVDDRTFVNVCLAGPAVDLERERLTLDNVRDDAWKDFEMAGEFIQRNGWDETALVSEALVWVQSETAAIEAVAERLLIDKELSETEVAIIVGCADGEIDEAEKDQLLRVFGEGKR